MEPDPEKTDDTSPKLIDLDLDALDDDRFWMQTETAAPLKTEPQDKEENAMHASGDGDEISAGGTDEGSTLSTDAVTRLRDRAARDADSTTPRKVNLRMWLGEGADPAAEDERESEFSEPVSEPAAQSASEDVVPPPRERRKVMGHDEARRTLEQAIASGASLVLLIGPAGCGKSHYLSTLPTVNAVDLEKSTGHAWVEGVLAQLADRTEGPMLLALRGTAPVPSFSLQDGDVVKHFYSSASLVEATDGVLPLELAERVQTVVTFEAFEEAELEDVARSVLADNHPDTNLSPEALQTIVRQAMGSGRGAHELVSLLRRIPEGTWVPATKQVKGALPKALKTALRPAAKPTKKKPPARAMARPGRRN